MESNVDMYIKRKKLWASKEPTIPSVIGEEQIHLPDIKCSNELLNGLICTKRLKPQYALDCAAGIGRVTQYVLLNFFDCIDLFEQDEKFVNKIKENFTGNKKIRDISCCSMQKFDFKDKKYDLIWLQWCLENLEDYDLNSFLSKLYNGLNDNGIIIVKENYYEKSNEKDNEDFKYADSDFSKQRKDEFYINLFIQNNFKIIRHFVNPNYPDDIMPLIIYVLVKS